MDIINTCFICGEVLYKNNTEKHHVFGKRQSDVIIEICINCHNNLHPTRSGDDFIISEWENINNVLSKIQGNITAKRLIYRLIYLLSNIKKRS